MNTESRREFEEYWGKEGVTIEPPVLRLAFKEVSQKEWQVASNELTAVTEQRDRLAEAALNLCMALIAKDPIDITELMHAVGDALQSSKQLSPDPR